MDHVTTYEAPEYRSPITIHAEEAAGRLVCVRVTNAERQGGYLRCMLDETATDSEIVAAMHSATRSQIACIRRVRTVDVGYRRTRYYTTIWTADGSDIGKVDTVPRQA